MIAHNKEGQGRTPPFNRPGANRHIRSLEDEWW